MEVVLVMKFDLGHGQTADGLSFAQVEKVCARSCARSFLLDDEYFAVSKFFLRNAQSAYTLDEVVAARNAAANCFDRMSDFINTVNDNESDTARLTREVCERDREQLRALVRYFGDLQKQFNKCVQPWACGFGGIGCAVNDGAHIFTVPPGLAEK